MVGGLLAVVGHANTMTTHTRTRQRTLARLHANAHPCTHTLVHTYTAATRTYAATQTYTCAHMHAYAPLAQDLIGDDLPTRFKYRQVAATGFGVTDQEMLEVDEKTLSKRVPLRFIKRPYAQHDERKLKGIANKVRWQAKGAEVTMQAKEASSKAARKAAFDEKVARKAARKAAEAEAAAASGAAGGEGDEATAEKKKKKKAKHAGEAAEKPKKAAKKAAKKAGVMGVVAVEGTSAGAGGSDAAGGAEGSNGSRPNLAKRKKLTNEKQLKSSGGVMGGATCLRERGVLKHCAAIVRTGAVVQIRKRLRTVFGTALTALLSVPTRPPRFTTRDSQLYAPTRALLNFLRRFIQARRVRTAQGC